MTGDEAIKRPATIDDVAAHSGFGRATVSRVLNNAPNVSAKTRARVLQSVAALGYRVNVQARSLAGGRNLTLALICAADLEREPNSYYQSALEVGALRACSQAGFHLFTCAVPQDGSGWMDEILNVVDERRCDGVVLTPPFSDSLSLIARLRGRNCAVACVSASPDVQADVPGVAMDEVAAGAELAAHLLALGHRRFGFLRGLAGHGSAEGRFTGALRTLAGAGLDDTAVVDERGSFTFRSGRDLLPRVMQAAEPPTAVICANDDMAAGALFAAHRHGIDVPGRLAIAGFDDTPVSAIVWPPLTTIHQPIREMGSRAVMMLAETITAAPACAAPGLEMFDHRLVIRGSTSADWLEALPDEASAR